MMKQQLRWAFLLCSVTAAGVLLLPGFAHAQQAASPQNPATMSQDESTRKARQLLDRMIAAMGGDKWMQIQNREQEGRTAGFYHGAANGAYVDIFTAHAGLDKDRTEYTKKRNVVQIVVGKDGWELTFQGRRRMDRKALADFLRNRDHSLDTVLHTWMDKPGTALFYNGQKFYESHLCESVSIMTADNDSLDLLIDANTFRPRESIFYWRDPEYRDRNEEGESYDDWHMMDGIPTPLIITRYHNGEMTRQTYITKTMYNQPLPPDTFNPGQ